VGTLDARVRAALDGQGQISLGVVHRIDKETSGLVVFTRSWVGKQSLSSQFRAHTVHRRYLAIVHGLVRSQTIRSHFIEDRGDGLRGSIEAKHAWVQRAKGSAFYGSKQGVTPNSSGVLAVTHVELLEELEGASLIACTLETGKTHQIRIHLSELGHPLVGERVYSRGFQGAEIPASRLMLHAAELGFTHPKTELDVRWTSEPPSDFAQTLERLRA
jgi:23S rRNA pseudouridine1911/1915/1917 synthase